MGKQITKIAFIDSGYGGLLLASEVHKAFPQIDLVYIGDTKNMPYGEKEIGFLNDRYNSLQEFAKKQNADLLIVACNTLSATSFITEEKLVNSLDIISISADYINKSGTEKLTLIATPNTINSKIYKKYLNEKIAVVGIPAKNLATLIENGNLPDAVLEFNNLIGKYTGDIMLGCTHYSALLSKHENQNLISQHNILKDYLKNNFVFPEQKRESKVDIFVNSNKSKYDNFAKNLFANYKTKVEELDY